MAGQQDFHIACIQGTQLSFNSKWRTGDWQVFSLSKSGVSVSDGCIIATILPSCVKAIHRWEPGRVLGLRIQIGQGCSQLDLYVLNSFSPTNSQGASSEAREAHELSRAAHWQKCERVLLRIPRRCEPMWAMDGNARIGTALPWSRNTEVWNCNGGDLFDFLKEHHLKAANTFHAVRARSWTWQQQRQDKQIRHRLDYFINPMAAQWKCQVDHDSPVNLSGYRDHRPVGLLIPRRRR